MESENPADLGFIPIADGDDEISKLHKGFLAELKRHEDTLELIEQSYVKGGLRGSSTTSMGKPNSKGKSREDSTPSPAAAGADMISKLAALSKEGLEKEINGVLKEFDNAVENGIPSDGYFTTGFDGGDFYRGGMVTTPTMLYPSASEDHNGGGSATSTRGSVDGTSLSRERNGSSRRGGSASTGDAESPSMRTVAKQRQAQLNADAKEHCTLFLFAAMQLLDSSRNTEGSPSSNRLIDCESFNSNHTPGEIIRSGPLKKSKGDTTTALSVTRWAQKHCVLVPGFLNYYKVGVRSNESKSSLAGITGALFNRDDADDYEGGVGGGAAGIFGRTSKSTVGTGPLLPHFPLFIYSTRPFLFLHDRRRASVFRRHITTREGELSRSVPILSVARSREVRSSLRLQRQGVETSPSRESLWQRPGSSAMLGWWVVEPEHGPSLPAHDEPIQLTTPRMPSSALASYCCVAV